jgi:hypothetical protein
MKSLYLILTINGKDISISSILFILCGFLLIDCSRHAKSNDYEKLILGEWSFVTDFQNPPPTETNSDLPPPPPPPWDNVKHGYVFSANGNCENKLGYYKRFARKDHERSFVQFLGTSTKFKIEDDSLKIFNLSDSSWWAVKIFSITPDTMIFQFTDSTFSKYSRAFYHVDNSADFDQIIISSSGCYGTCPRSDVLIKRSGDLIFHGAEYNTKNGYFKGHVENPQYSKLENDFKKTNFLKLADKYFSGGTDREEISVSFIKNDTIVKTISDYGRAAPPEFYWAYIPTRYLYQSIALDTISKIPGYLLINHLRFEKGNKICPLSRSESFYLWNLLLNSSLVQITFKPQYNLGFRGTENLLRITTDGQYFRFELKDKSRFTLKLKFNFLTANKFDSKFWQKDEYE